MKKRRLLLLPVLFFLIPNSCLTIKQSEPPETQSDVIPFVVNFQHWDHHWYLSIPEHPVYETIEVMSVEQPYFKLIWLFFTERNGSKHQIHYLNDSKISDTWPGSTYTKMTYRSSGPQGYGKNLYISMIDTNGENIVFEVEVDTTRDLQKAGLTNQSGHNNDNMFLVFFREKQIFALKAKLTISSKIYGLSAENICAYSSNVFTPVISYGKYMFTKASDSVIIGPSGRIFRPTVNEQGKIFTGSPIYYDDTVKVCFGNDNFLSNYTIKTGSHQFSINLLKQNDNRSSYTISIDTFPSLITGVMDHFINDREISFQWNNLTPDWTKEYSFESIITPFDSGYVLVTK